jgi:dsDNA-specific endonuclease/ATPase MutS2
MVTSFPSIFEILLYSCFVTYPGRSNAINIAERLGLPSDIIGSARQLLGTAGAEINAVCLIRS